MKDFKINVKWVIPILILAIGFFSLTGSYNGLNRQKQEVDLAQSTIETALQRRYDLVPNVVNATKGYLLHEQKSWVKLRTPELRLETPLPKIAKLKVNYQTLYHDY